MSHLDERTSAHPVLSTAPHEQTLIGVLGGVVLVSTAPCSNYLATNIIVVIQE